jgi:hypothetical protein
MTRRNRKSSGFDDQHPFWAKALDLWRRGYSNAQVADEAQVEGLDFNEDQVRYARNRYWKADELPARGASWLREAIRQATDVYPSALEQQQALFTENYEVFVALKQRLLGYLSGTPPVDGLELAQMKVLLESYARQGRLLNETNDTITVLQAKLGRLAPEPAEPEPSHYTMPEGGDEV